jgi:hypothetical protein
MSKVQLRRFWEHLDSSKYNLPDDLINEITKAFMFAIDPDPEIAITLDELLSPPKSSTISPIKSHSPQIELADFLAGCSFSQTTQSNQSTQSSQLTTPIEIDSIVINELSVSSPLSIKSPQQIQLDDSRDITTKLQTWELNSTGARKNLRNLIASLSTVLWPDSGWKPLSLSQLMTPVEIKKAYRQILLIVHPDKLTSHPTHHQLIGAHVFDVIVTSYKDFQNSV